MDQIKNIFGWATSFYSKIYLLIIIGEENYSEYQLLTNYHIFIINVPHTAFGFNLAFSLYCSSICSLWKFFEEKFFKVLYPLHQ